MIEAVIFDLGDTLVRFDNRAPHRPWERRLGLMPGSLWEMVGAAVDWSDAFLGGDEDAPWVATAEALGVPIDELDQLRDDFFACERIDDELFEFARSLRPRYRTAILSDAPAGARRTIAKFGFDKCIDAVVLSGEIKVGKPDPRAFQAALDALAVAPERTVFVDNAQINIDGARALGMQTVHCTTASDTITALAAILSE